jgi:hypothetical protein
MQPSSSVLCVAQVDTTCQVANLTQIYRGKKIKLILPRKSPIRYDLLNFTCNYASSYNTTTYIYINALLLMLIFQRTQTSASGAATPRVVPAKSTQTSVSGATRGRGTSGNTFKPPRKRADAQSEPRQSSAPSQPAAARGRGSGAKKRRRSAYAYFTCSGNY